RVQGVQPLAAAHVDVAAGDQHRFRRGAGLGGDAPAVAAVGGVEGVDRAEVVGEVDPAAGHRRARDEGGRAQEDRRGLEVPADVPGGGLQGEHAGAGGDVDVAV